MSRNRGEDKLYGAAAETTGRVVHAIMKRVYDAGGTDRNWRELDTEAGETVLDTIAGIIAGRPSVERFMVRVDPGLTNGERIAAAEYFNSSLDPSRFPAPFGPADVEIQLLHYGRSVPSRAVLSELALRECQPPSIAEFLSLAAQYPWRSSPFDMAAVGLATEGLAPKVPNILCNGEARWLCLVDADMVWHEASTRFVAVRRQFPTS